MASDAKPATISDLVAMGAALIVDLKSRLLADSVTAEYALRTAADSLGSVERNLTLAGLVISQQHTNARERAATPPKSKATR